MFVCFLSLQYVVCNYSLVLFYIPIGFIIFFYLLSANVLSLKYQVWRDERKSGPDATLINFSLQTE